METKEVMVYGMIEAVKAEIEAMKWDNQQRVLNGCTDPGQFNYQPNDFFEKAQEIRNATNELFK